MCYYSCEVKRAGVLSSTCFILVMSAGSNSFRQVFLPKVAKEKTWLALAVFVKGFALCWGIKFTDVADSDGRM